MNIPQEAVEAAVLAMDGASLCGCSDCQRATALNILAAALPHIEKEIRAQVAAELRGELPVQLAETAGSDTGWLSDLQYVSPETSADFERVELPTCGSIDIAHIAEHAARIAEGESE